MTLLLLNKKKSLVNPTFLPNLQLWLDATQINAQGYSLDFNGTSSFVQANNVITAYPFTLECWVRLNVTNVNQSFIFLSKTGASDTYFGLRYITSSGKFAVYSRNGASEFITSSTTTALANTWTHLAAVFTSATSRTIYVNGVSEATGVDNSAYNSASMVVLMGLFRDLNPGAYLNGKLSDVRIWNTARTAKQIADNYQRRLIGNELGLVGYWRIDRGTGTTITDWTSNNNTGTINGAVWDNSEPLTEPIDDNTAVRVWQDQSGNSYNAEQSGTAARPTYRTNQLNGLPAVVFDGTDDRLSLVSGALGMLRNVAGATVFVVVRYANNATVQRSIFIATNTSGSSRFLLTSLTTNVLSVGGRRLDANSFQSVDTSNAISSNFLIHTGFINYSNSTAQQYINNQLNGSSTTFQTAGNTSDTNSFTITIGGNDNSQFLNGAIAEIIVYNRALNTSELSQVHRYLSRKWGIALA